MNIIKHGHTPKLYYGKCTQCGCEFEFTKDDVEYDEGSQYEPTDYKTCTLRCPECRRIILCASNKNITKEMFLIKYLEYMKNLEYMQVRLYESMVETKNGSIVCVKEEDINETN